MSREKEVEPSSDGRDEESKSNVRSLAWARVEPPKKPDDGPLLEGPTAEERAKKAREEQLENTKRLARELKASPKKGRGPGDRRH